MDDVYEYVEMQIGDEGTIWVEISPAGGPFLAEGEEQISKLEDAFENAMSTVRKLATGVVNHVSAFSKEIRPQETSLEFGMTFKGEVAVVVAKASGEANFNVTLTWKEPETDV